MFLVVVAVVVIVTVVFWHVISDYLLIGFNIILELVLGRRHRNQNGWFRFELVIVQDFFVRPNIHAAAAVVFIVNVIGRAVVESSENRWHMIFVQFG